MIAAYLLSLLKWPLQTRMAAPTVQSQHQMTDIFEKLFMAILFCSQSFCQKNCCEKNGLTSNKPIQCPLNYGEFNKVSKFVIQFWVQFC